MADRDDTNPPPSEESIERSIDRTVSMDSAASSSSRDPLSSFVVRVQRLVAKNPPSASPSNSADDLTRSLLAQLVEAGHISPAFKTTIGDLLTEMPSQFASLGSVTCDAQESDLYATSRDDAWHSQKRIHDYEILSEIARGGMGVVYKARQVKLNRTVALKTIQSGDLADERQISRFYAEAEAAGKLDHPGIVSVYEVGEHNGQHYYSMAFIEGESLNALVKREGPLQPKRAAEIIRDSARAVQHAHNADVVHRDIKPANILLDRSGQSRVTDFGLAKLRHKGNEITTTGQVLGTPAYMPLEQAVGRVEEVGIAADVYSLGATLYFLLTGRPPHQSANVADTLRQVVESEPIPPRNLDPSIPRDLETICLKCLRKEISGRYATAEALADDLGKWIDGAPIVGRRVGRSERVWKWCKRKPVVASLAAGILLVFLVGLVTTSAMALLAYQRNSELSTALDVSEARSHALNVAFADLLWKNGDAQMAWHYLDSTQPERRGWEYDYLYSRFHWNHSTLVIRPAESGDLISCVAIGPDRQTVFSASLFGTLQFWNLETGRATMLVRGFKPGTEVQEPEAELAVFSPDGERVLSGHYDALKLWDSKTGDLILTFNSNQIPTSLAINHDGTVAASGGRNGTIKLWNLNDGSLLHSLVINGSTQSLSVRDLSFCPTGEFLVSAGSSVIRDEGRIVVWNVATGEASLTLGESLTEVYSVAFSPNGNRIAAGYEGQIKIWQFDTEDELLTINDAHTSAVTSLKFHADGERIVSGSWDNTVAVWHANSGQLVQRLIGHIAEVSHVEFGLTQSNVISTSSESREEISIKVWNLEAEAQDIVLEHPSVVSNIAFSSDGRTLMTAGIEVLLWDAYDGRLKHTIPGSKPATFSPDGSVVATNSDNDEIVAWNTSTGDQVRVITEFDGFVSHLAFSHDGAHLLAATEDYDEEQLTVWDARTGSTVRVHTRHRLPAVSPDGITLASALSNEIVLTDARTGRKLRSFAAQEESVSINCVAFGPDGKRLVTAGYEHVVKVWDVATGRQLVTLSGHTDHITGLVFSPDGMRLASASRDNTVKIWDVQTGQEVYTFRDHDDDVTCIAFSSDGKRLASASRNGRIVIWNASRGPTESMRNFESAE